MPGSDDEVRASMPLSYLRELLEQRARLQSRIDEAMTAVEGVDLREGHIRDNADPDQLRSMLLGVAIRAAELEAERDRLLARIAELEARP